MTRIRRGSIGVCGVCVLLMIPSTGEARPAAPQEPSGAAVPLTLDEAVRRGLETSHRLAEMAAREAAARATVEARGAAELPLLSLLGGYTRTNHVDPFGIAIPGGPFREIYPDIPDNYRARLDLQWPIFTSGRLQAAARAAAAELEASGKDLAAARADLRLEITRAYWALLTASESVRVVEEALKRTEAHLRDVRNRLQVGLVPPSDALSAEAQRSRQEVLLIEARNTRDVAAAELARLAGAAPDTAFLPTDRLEALPPPPGAVADLVSEARASRPEREALARRIAGAGERRTAAAAAARPVVSLAGGVDYARPNPRIFPRSRDWNESWDAGVNVAWSLWDGGRVRADVAEASALERAATERLREFDRGLEVEVRQRRLDLESARAAIASATAAVTAAAEARRIVTERYTAGVATNTEVLDAEVALLQAELDRTRALANTRLAAARLDRALGR